jgi:hypothetical protein
MQEAYIRAKRIIAYLGPPFERLDALVAYRNCYKTKKAWVRRPLAPSGRFMQFSPDCRIVRANQSPFRIVTSLMGMITPYFYLRYGISIFTSRSFAQKLATVLTVLNVRYTFKALLSQNKILPKGKPKPLFSHSQLAYALADFFAHP